MQEVVNQLPEGPKKDEIVKHLAYYKDAEKMLEAKLNLLAPQKQESSEPHAKVMYGDRVCEIATKIQQKYIDNAAYWASIDPSEMNLFESITKLAQDL